jgi:hypothetical protein
MNIHEKQNSKNKRKATCGYCREEGHNQYQCPHVRGDWENFLSKLMVPRDADGNIIKRGYNAMYWGDNFDPLKDELYSSSFTSWFNNCRHAYLVQKKRGFSLKHKAQKSTKVRTCGFCGDTGHTRRNCGHMKDFLKRCYKANENWRRAAYKEIVLDHGISVGAVVEVVEKSGYGSNERITTSLGIIKSINWDKANVFASLSKKSDTARSPFEIEVLVGNRNVKLNNLKECFNTIAENGETLYSWRSNGASLKAVITHSPTPLDPKWITSYRESFETLVKKRTLEQLRDGMKNEWRAPNLVAHINAWC